MILLLLLFYINIHIIQTKCLPALWFLVCGTFLGLFWWVLSGVRIYSCEWWLLRSWTNSKHSFLYPLYDGEIHVSLMHTIITARQTSSSQCHRRWWAAFEVGCPDALRINSLAALPPLLHFWDMAKNALDKPMFLETSLACIVFSPKVSICILSAELYLQWEYLSWTSTTFFSAVLRSFHFYISVIHYILSSFDLPFFLCSRLPDNQWYAIWCNDSIGIICILLVLVSALWGDSEDSIHLPLVVELLILWQQAWNVCRSYIYTPTVFSLPPPNQPIQKFPPFCPNKVHSYET